MKLRPLYWCQTGVCHEKQLLCGWLFSLAGITLTFYPHSPSHAASASPCPCSPAGLVLQSDWCTFTQKGVLCSSEAGTPQSKPLNTNHILLFPLWEALCVNEHIELWAFVLQMREHFESNISIIIGSISRNTNENHWAAALKPPQLIFAGSSTRR